MSGIDIVIQIWKLLNVPTVVGMLGDGKVWQHNRPRNSQFTDIVISVPEYNNTALTKGFVDVNIHSPNLKNYYPIPSIGEDTTFPNLGTFKPIADAVLPLLVSVSGLYLRPDIAGVPIRDKDGEWYVNIRVNFETLNPSDSVQVSLYEEIGTDDGYGGSVVSLALIGTEMATKVNVKSGNQLNINAGRYELIESCDWLLASDTITPKKNSQLVAPDGTYVINGIIKSGIFWQLSTLRKDGDY